MVLKVTILDGYTDEPAGLGVPPYLDVYPRYAAGVIWSHEKDAIIKYVTVDEARKDWGSFYRIAGESDLTIVIAGVVVPGRYLAANPLLPQEAIEIGRRLQVTRTFSILAGPAAKFGMGLEGGKPAVSSRLLEKYYDASVRGDIEVYLNDLLVHGEEKAEPWRRREDYELIDKIAPRGAPIVKQHPNYGYNLMVELETYRGCSRWVTGGCSFCVEPLYGRPLGRSAQGIVREAEALYSLGVRGFRLGRQADILVYGTTKFGRDEFPPPEPREIEKLFRGVRNAVGDSLLHIDNVNPGTIYHNKEESIKALKVIVKYHSPGDVAAMGLESADEKVIKLNNLNTSPEETLEAIRIVNRIGGLRAATGFPHLLPGINFVLGLPGESKETYRKNIEFLNRVLKEGLLVRRINIRRAMPLPETRLSVMWSQGILRKHEKYARSFTWRVRHYYDVEFLKKVFPKEIVLHGIYIEKTINGVTYGRPMGSYPITVELQGKLNPPCIVNIRVVGWKGRSIKGVVKERILCPSEDRHGLEKPVLPEAHN